MIMLINVAIIMIVYVVLFLIILLVPEFRTSVTGAALQFVVYYFSSSYCFIATCYVTYSLHNEKVVAYSHENVNEKYEEL